MNDANGAQRREQGNSALPGHPDKFPKRNAPAFAVLLDCLLPSVRNFRALVDALDNRAPIETIRQWRSGRRTAPRWAVDLLARKIAERAALAESAVASYHPPTHRGEYGARVLRRYNKQRADAKADPSGTA